MKEGGGTNRGAEDIPMRVQEGKASCPRAPPHVTGQSGDRTKVVAEAQRGRNMVQGRLGVTEPGNDQILILNGFLGFQYEEEMATAVASEYGKPQLGGRSISFGKDDDKLV